MGRQSLGTKRTGAGKPTANGHLGHAEGVSDVALKPASPLQLQ